MRLKKKNFSNCEKLKPYIWNELKNYLVKESLNKIYKKHWMQYFVNGSLEAVLKTLNVLNVL
jgi:hypothetical protein